MLSVFGMPPIEFVQLVADLGCRYITTGMVGFAPLKALDYQPYSLRDDPRLRQGLLAALPDDRVVGLEIPMRSRAEAGVSAYDRLLPCVNSARALLAGARETRLVSAT
jgi:hypothetical protein